MKLFKNSDRKIVSTGLAIAFGTMLMLFVVLHFTSISSLLGTLLSYISSVVWGLAIAYLIRPFTKAIRDKLPKRIQSEKVRARIGAACSLVLLLLVVVLLFFMLIPRAVESAADFLKNFDTNLESLKQIVKDFAADISFIDISDESIERFIGNSETLLKSAASWLQTNYNEVLAVLSNVVSIVVDFIIVLTISIYALFDMDNIRRNAERVERALFGLEKSNRINAVLARGDALMTNFLSSNIIDALIIGVVNFIFLTLMDAPYTLILSVILGITNFVPTFGPIVGAVIGGFIILLTDSQLLLTFIIFTVVLQQIDGNVLKPILFGDSTGLSGFWVMVSIVVGGEMFGVLGMVLGVPVVAFIGTILDAVLHRVNGSDDLYMPEEKTKKFSLSRLFKRNKEKRS
ncbi:MAG: AI-2E family transporter [Clostridia bacterium]|nr:AI-2E family transporter [Clostridia bacterium]